MKKLIVLILIFTSFSIHMPAFAEGNDPIVLDNSTTSDEAEQEPTYEEEQDVSGYEEESVEDATEAEKEVVEQAGKETEPKNNKEIKNQEDHELNVTAKSNVPQTAEEWLEYAASQSASSDRIAIYLEGYNLYPTDERFVAGIRSSVNSLLTWTTNQHQDGRFEVAIGRYHFILELPELTERLVKETEVKLSYAEVDKKIPTANELNNIANQEPSSSPKLERFIEGYYLYPNDARFESGINASARSLLNWAIKQHDEGNFEVAVGRYEFILEAPMLVSSIRITTEDKLTEALQGKRSADVILAQANKQSASSDRLALFIEGHNLYPNDERFTAGINTSVRSLLTWTNTQHQDGRYDVAIGRYEFILTAPKLSGILRKEIEVKLKYAVENRRIPTANQLINLANSETSSSPRLERFIDGYVLYPTDARFEAGINRNVDSLLKWTIDQHIDGRFEVAIGRYEFILSVPNLNNNLRQATEFKLAYAKEGERIPSAAELIKLANDEASSSPRLERFIQGYTLYPNDKRFETGINQSATSLLNWAINQHHDGRFDVAIGRYELILSAPVLSQHIRANTDAKLKEARQGKRPANVIFQLAQKQTSSSDSLTLYMDGYKFYPNDSRFQTGINNSSRSLLRWATTQHQDGHYETAAGRYELILSAPVLNKALRDEAEIKLKYAKQNKKIPNANQLVQEANSQSASSAKLDLFIEGYILYPSDKRFEAGIASSARSLLNWAETQHKAGDFATAIGRYKKIIASPAVPEGIKNLARHYEQLANNRQQINSNKKVVNPKVQNYTYAQMEKDIKALEAMYPYLIKTFTIGKSLDGRNLYAIRLGHGKTEVMFNASAHAREHMTTNVIMNMLDEYAYAYIRGNNFGGFNVRQVLDQTTIWFLPMNNPDGVSLVQLGPDALGSNLAQNAIKINGGSRTFTSWKANARGVDLNRNYPVLWNTVANNPGRPSISHYKGPLPLSEPESRAMYNFILTRNFKTLVDYHSSGEVLYARLPGHIENLVSRKTGYRIIDETLFTSGGDLPTWFTIELGMPGLTPEISPYVVNRPVPVGNWDSIWRKNDSVGLIVADEAYKSNR